jgi:hypothetical protein
MLRTPRPLYLLILLLTGLGCDESGVTSSNATAAQLGIRTQPALAVSGAPLGTGPVIEVQDANGNVVAADNSTVVTAAIATGGGTLEGSANATASAGVATFGNLTIRGTVGPRTLSFTAPGLTSATSGSVSLAPGAASAAMSTLSLSADAVEVGATVDLGLTVRDSEGNRHTGGGRTVVFTAGGGSSVGTISSTTDNGDGTYTATFTATGAGTALSVGATIDDVAVTTAEPSLQVVLMSTNSPVPLIDMQNVAYRGFAGGLYPGGNVMPAAHDAEGVARAAAIAPLDVNGNADPTGRYVMISIGMSNTTQEFCQKNSAPPCDSWTFMGQAAADGAVNTAELRIVNGARSGQEASAWESPTSMNYDVARDTWLTPLGRSEAQVQVAWVKVANANPTASLPDGSADAYVLIQRMGNIMRTLKIRYPNLRMVFLSSRTYAGFANIGLNPEPYAYETGFAVKWLIEAQITQLSGGGVDARAGDLDYNTVAPWLAWGPYLWADGPTANSEGLSWTVADVEEDGTHPSQSGETKVGTKLLDFFKASPHATPWFLN